MIKELCEVEFPHFMGVRVLMMPFHLHDLATLPEFLQHYRHLIGALVIAAPIQKGTAYLTVDEAHLVKGQVHRRPGLHVDGWKFEGSSNGGTWGSGGSGGTWGGTGGGKVKDIGMLMVASHLGSRGWDKPLTGKPKIYGDCEHLRSDYPLEDAIPFSGGRAFGLSGLCVHESIPIDRNCNRQFVRISMPSTGDWNSSNTPNPLGIMPDGPIVFPRPIDFTGYSPMTATATD